MLNVQYNFTTRWNITKLRITGDYCPKQQQTVDLSNVDGLVLNDVGTEALFTT